MGSSSYLSSRGHCTATAISITIKETQNNGKHFGREKNEKRNREVKHASRCADKMVSQITEGHDGIPEDAQECWGEDDKTEEKEDDEERE